MRTVGSKGLGERTHSPPTLNWLPLLSPDGPLLLLRKNTSPGKTKAELAARAASRGEQLRIKTTVSDTHTHTQTKNVRKQKP